MPMQFEDPYAAEQERAKWLNRGEFVLAQILRAIFYVIKLVLKMAWEVVKNLLRMIGVPIGN